MTEISDRYQRVAAQFTDRVRAVPADAWDNPTPCEGWVARDVVRHLVDWPQQYFAENYDLGFPTGPSPDEDPAGAWEVIDRTFASALADPDVAGIVRETRMGSRRLDETLDMILTGDVLIHTWDLARAAGLDDTLDAETVARMAAAFGSMDEDMLTSSGQFGPRVAVPADADDQTKLIAFSGRTP